MISLPAAFLSNYLRYNTHGLLTVAAALFNISVGLIILLREPHSSINRSFFLVTLTAFIWAGSFGMHSLVKDFDDSYFWQAISYVMGVPFIPVSFYWFSVCWSNKRDKRSLLYLAFIWAFAAMIPMTFFTRYVVGMQEFPWGRFPYFTPDLFGYSYAIFLLIPFFTLGILGFVNFYQGYRRAVAPKERAQGRNILIAYLIAYTGMLDFITAFRIPYYPFGYLSLTTFIGIIAYNIVRHQFLEINVLLRKFTVIFGPVPNRVEK